MLIKWRAGLRISEALDLERRDVQVDVDHPTLRVRHGKANRARLVPVHPELGAIAFDHADLSRPPAGPTRHPGGGRPLLLPRTADSAYQIQPQTP